MKIKKYYLITFIFSMIILFLLAFFLGKYLNVKKQDYQIIDDKLYVTYNDKKDDILLINLKAMSQEQASKNKNNNIIFTIHGDNLKESNLYYTIKLSESDPVYLKKSINFKNLSYRLVEIKDDQEIEIIKKANFENNNEINLLTNIIAPNTVKINKKYKLTIWLDSATNTDYHEIYYANIKMKVEGTR